MSRNTSFTVDTFHLIQNGYTIAIKRMRCVGGVYDRNTAESPSRRSDDTNLEERAPLPVRSHCINACESENSDVASVAEHNVGKTNGGEIFERMEGKASRHNDEEYLRLQVQADMTRPSPKHYTAKHVAFSPS